MTVKRVPFRPVFSVLTGRPDQNTSQKILSTDDRACTPYVSRTFQPSTSQSLCASRRPSSRTAENAAFCHAVSSHEEPPPRGQAREPHRAGALELSSERHAPLEPMVAAEPRLTRSSLHLVPKQTPAGGHQAARAVFTRELHLPAHHRGRPRRRRRPRRCDGTRARRASHARLARLSTRAPPGPGSTGPPRLPPADRPPHPLASSQARKVKTSAVADAADGVDGRVLPGANRRISRRLTVRRWRSTACPTCRRRTRTCTATRTGTTW